MTYTPFDYLCNEPFYLSGIGHIKCPTLRDIRTIQYQTFSMYLNILSTSWYDYLKNSGSYEHYESLNKEQQAEFTVYNLLMLSTPAFLLDLLSYFTEGTVIFDECLFSFLVYEDNDGKKVKVGEINNENFEFFRDELRKILGIKKSESEEPKFKNEYARKLYEMMQHSPQTQKQEVDENYTLDNMIRKFCTHNKTGINLLNVWDLTYYQFMILFQEYAAARQYDYYDNMAANTFSFKKSSDYKPMDYMKKNK